MNTNPKAIRILAYGDSNTWGRIPGDDVGKRFEINIRWTGVLQNILGNNFEVIEEGLNGRTTHLESPNKAGKNGNSYLFASVESHNPIDLVILAIGKNNLKSQYNQSAEDIGYGIEMCLDTIEAEAKTKAGTTPKIILVTPLIIQEKARERWGNRVVDMEGGHQKSLVLPKVYQEIAQRRNLIFLDLNNVAKVSYVDGIHLDESTHKVIGDIIAKEVLKLFSTDIAGL